MGNQIRDTADIGRTIRKVDTFERYEWSPIQSRTLELQPINPANPDALHCKLITAKLKDYPEYQAISYAWGAVVLSKLLFMDRGAPMSITAN
jgi:hypothetical protein